MADQLNASAGSRTSLPSAAVAAAVNICFAPLPRSACAGVTEIFATWSTTCNGMLVRARPAVTLSVPVPGAWACSVVPVTPAIDAGTTRTDTAPWAGLPRSSSAYTGAGTVVPESSVSALPSLATAVAGRPGRVRAL